MELDLEVCVHFGRLVGGCHFLQLSAAGRARRHRGRSGGLSPLPQDGGSYRGYWKIQSPWGMLFGDSGSGNAFWVDILVGSGTPGNSKTETAYGITAVTYDVAYRCTPANQFETVTAHISSNGPVTAVFTWMQSDGNNKANNKITFTGAETKSVTREWSWGIATSRNLRWVSVTITCSFVPRVWSGLPSDGVLAVTVGARDLHGLFLFQGTFPLGWGVIVY